MTSNPTDRPDQQLDWSTLGAFVRLVPDAALAVDTRGIVRAANELAADVFGYAAGELVGASVEDLLPERSRAIHARHRADYRRRPHHRRMGVGLDLWGRRKDGREVPVDISLAPVGAPGGGPDGTVVIAAVRDMTGRRREQEAQAQLAAIVSSTDDAVVATGPDGTIISWNPRATRLLGYEPDDIVGRPVETLVPERLRPDLDDQLRRVMAGERLPPFETLRRRRDGADVDVEATLSAIRADQVRLLGVAGVFRDISERVRARADRARAERPFPTSSATRRPRRAGSRSRSPPTASSR